jgi:nucleotide-binding universal stress UspA family protein
MRILMPVDGSVHSKAALDFVASRTTLIEQEPEIRLLNVQPTISARVARAVGREDARAFQRESADDVLRPSVACLKKAGIAARANYALGGRADAIAAVAARSRCDLIVMGSRGHSALKGLVFGSMTNAVLAGCTKPLLVLRSGKAPKKDSLAVGIALDGSRYGLAAVRWALKRRELFGAEPRFHLIHVLPDPASSPGAHLPYQPTPAETPAQIEAAQAAAFDKVIAPARRLFSKAGLKAATVRLQSHNLGDAIVAHALHQRIDVLVLGSHGYGRLKSLVLGSVAMRVAGRCDKPLLLIRER